MEETLSKQTLSDLYSQYSSIKEIAKNTKRSPKTISKLMKEFNLKYEKSARKYLVNPDFFNQDTEQSFYWAGFIAANANIVNNAGYRIEFNISAQDKEHLEELHQAIGSDAPVKDFITTKNGQINQHVRTVISSKYLVESLEERFFVTPKKKHSYEMPNWLMVHEDVRRFIRGWCDGAGGISTAHNQFAFTTRGTHSMMSQLRMIFINQLRITDNSLISVKKIDKSELELLTISDRKTLKGIRDFLYLNSNVFLARKKFEIEEV